MSFSLVRTHERLNREHDQKMESASALFRTGNYRATMECFDLLASTKLEFGINGAILDGLFTLVGQDTLRERFVTRELLFELRARATFLLMFRDKDSRQMLDGLIGRHVSGEEERPR